MQTQDIALENEGYLNADPTNYADVEALIIQLAGKFYPRIRALNLPYEFEDVVSELNIVWLKARVGFDPALGFRFSTYFVKSAYSHINVLCARQSRLHVVSENTGGGEDGEDFSLFDLHPCTAPTPYEALEAADSASDRLSRLSPIAQLVVEWLEHPPAELEAEFAALTAKRELEAKRRGQRAKTPPRIAVALDVVQRVFDLSVPKRYAVLAELKRLADSPN